MQELSKYDRLTALVLGSPPGSGCALMRARHSLGLGHGRLSDMAAKIGFSYAEAWGIMDGWDGRENRDKCTHPELAAAIAEDPYAYLRCRELGARLRRIAP